MKKNLLQKILLVINQRPTKIISYFFSAYRFYQTRLLRLFFMNTKNIIIKKNVRIEALKTLLAEEKARLMIGNHSVIYENARIEAYGQGAISLGDFALIGDTKIISRHKITIGTHFMTSWNVFIQDFDSHPLPAHLRKEQVEMMTLNFFPSFDKEFIPSHPHFHWDFPVDEIKIGDNVWVGANVTILKGAMIGDNCVISTGSVVKKGHYPAGSIIAGNPAVALERKNV